MNKVAVVTGASKGIGAATAVAFAKAGYDVVINYFSDIEAAQKIASEIENFGQKAITVQADVFTEQGVKELFNEIAKNFSKIDVLVNNAGRTGPEPEFGNFTCDDINMLLGANFGALVLCTQEAVKLMDKGCILFTSSIYGLPFGGKPVLPLYSAARAATINFAQTMSEKLAPNIRCNVVAPGNTLTPAREKQPKEYADKCLAMTLQKEWVSPDEIANTFVFLAETPHLTSQTIVVDAGWQKKIHL